VDATNEGDIQSQLVRYKIVIEEILNEIPLNLNGIRVLTEAASGSFAVTPILAAVAGAEHVVALGADSRFGLFRDVRHRLEILSDYFGVRKKITLSDKDNVSFAKDSDLVTNLGFVRPISRTVISLLPRNSVISLMWAPWEFRDGDIDAVAAKEFDIPIVATNEENPMVATFDYLGVLAVKLLVDNGHPIFRQRIGVIGSNPFGKKIADFLTGMGATVILIDPLDKWPIPRGARVFSPQVLVICEHRTNVELLGDKSEGEVRTWIERATPIIHICGNIDADYLRIHNCEVFPKVVAPYGYMSATTGDLGLEPVARLHAAGMHAGSIAFRARVLGASTLQAVTAATQSGFALALDGVSELE
jgi:hypothetical protein